MLRHFLTERLGKRKRTAIKVAARVSFKGMRSPLDGTDVGGGQCRRTSYDDEICEFGSIDQTITQQGAILPRTSGSEEAGAAPLPKDSKQDGSTRLRHRLSQSGGALSFGSRLVPIALALSGAVSILYDLRRREIGIMGQVQVFAAGILKSDDIRSRLSSRWHVITQH